VLLLNFRTWTVRAAGIFHYSIASGLQIDFHVIRRLRATHQQITFGGLLQRLGLVPYGTADQTGLAHVADASSA
jgi:hypothetical protein